MLRKVLSIACALWLVWNSARAEIPELVSFQECEGRTLDCYQNVEQIRSIQLTSQTQKFLVEREYAALDDWKAHRQYRLAALWGQYALTWILLVVGIVIVIIGLVMSFWHMLYAFKAGSAAENAFEAGKDGIRLSSPVIGLFVFGASIWFFNVYIDKVYKLTELQKAAAPASNEEDAGASGPRPDVTPTPPATVKAKPADAAKPAQQGNGSVAKPAQPGNTSTSKPPVPAT